MHLNKGHTHEFEQLLAVIVVLAGDLDQTTTELVHGLSVACLRCLCKLLLCHFTSLVSFLN